MPRDDPKVDRAVRQVGENLGIIVAEGERLTGLINDLLDLAKIEAGRFEWRLAPLALEDVVRQALASTSALFEVSGLTLETAIADGLPEVNGDRGPARPGRDQPRLERGEVHARRRRPRGGDRGGRRRRAAGPGLGRPTPAGGSRPEDVDRIFEPFRQSSDTVPDGPKGTGLGLPISRQIVEAHGGVLDVDSVPGEGSTFWFRVPALA